MAGASQRVRFGALLPRSTGRDSAWTEARVPLERGSVCVKMPLRSKTKNFVIGLPSDLPVNQLPTNQDVVNYVRLLLGEKMGVLRAKDLSDGIFKTVAKKVFSESKKSSQSPEPICNEVKYCLVLLVDLNQESPELLVTHLLHSWKILVSSSVHK